MFVADAASGLGSAATPARMNRQLLAADGAANRLATRQRGSRVVTLVCGVLSDGVTEARNERATPQAADVTATVVRSLSALLQPPHLGGGERCR